MYNEYEEYIKKVKKEENLSGDKKAQYIEDINILKNKGMPVILNSYHFSNIVGIRWNDIKYIIDSIEKQYHIFFVSKKYSSSKRVISAPNEKIKFLQNWIKENILEKVNISGAAYGFVNNKNIIENAKLHLNQEMVLNIDLKDFFPSIGVRRIYYVYNKLCGYNKNISYILTKISVYKGELPQGSPISPILSNIVTYKLDKRLKSLAIKNNINYSRYADDMTFSGQSNKVNDHFYSIVKKIIEEEGFAINTEKVRFAGKGRRQEVTGLVVNGQTVAVSKNYLREIRQELYYIKKFGLENHREKREFNNLFYRDHLKGKIMFVRMVDKKKGEEFLEMYNDIFDD